MVVPNRELYKAAAITFSCSTFLLDYRLLLSERYCLRTIYCR